MAFGLDSVRARRNQTCPGCSSWSTSLSPARPEWEDPSEEVSYRVQFLRVGQFRWPSEELATESGLRPLEVIGICAGASSHKWEHKPPFLLQAHTMRRDIPASSHGRSGNLTAGSLLPDDSALQPAGPHVPVGVVSHCGASRSGCTHQGSKGSCRSPNSQSAIPRTGGHQPEKLFS